MSDTPLLAACRRALTGALSVSLLVMAAAAAAQHPKADIQPKAAEVLKAASDTLASARMMTFRASTFYDVVEASGIKTKVVKQTRFFVKRPDRLHVRAQRDDGAQRYVWFDGKTLVRYEPGTNTASRMDAPKTLDALLDHLADGYRVSLPLADLLYADPSAAFSEHLLSGAYLGKRLVDGVWCHHLSFESDAADFQLWITMGDRPLPRRFAVTYVEEPGEPELEATLSDWDLNAYLDDGMFHATPPKDAKEVSFESRSK